MTATKEYTCDHCNQTYRGAPAVVLEGVAGRAGLALPGAFHVRHFCCPDCFWVWKGENMPQAVAPPPDLANTVFEL